MRLSNSIHKSTRKHKVPANIYTAILMQESGYRLSAKGCHKGLRVLTINLKNGPVSTLEEETKICSDFGMSQIYYKTAKGFKFDIDRLLTDLDYSVEAGTIVLADFRKRYSHKEVEWYVRYNCGTRGLTSRATCQIYKKLVIRYL